MKSGKYKLEYIEEQDPDNDKQIIVRLVYKGENLVDMFLEKWEDNSNGR